MIEIKLNRNKKGGHNNLFLELPKINFIKEADTYYFALDNLFMREIETSTKVRLNLINLFEHWINSINNLKKDDIVYLPFDFSDQYIGCLRIEKIDIDNISLSYGYTTQYDGTSLSPSSFEDFKISNQDYILVTESFTCLKSIIIEKIKLSIENLRD